MGYVDVAGLQHVLPDGRVLFADVSFRVGEGAKVALVGPNGAGKTSTLRMLATLQLPSRGAIRIDKLDAARDAEGVRRRVGYLPDNFALYDQMTPVDYLGNPASAVGIPERMFNPSRGPTPETEIKR